MFNAHQLRLARILLQDEYIVGLRLTRGQMTDLVMDNFNWLNSVDDARVLLDSVL